MCSPFRKESSKELKRDNFVKKLAYSNSWDSRYSRTRTNLFFKGKKELRRYFLRVFNSRNIPREASDSVTSMQAFSRVNIFVSSRTGARDDIEWV